MIYYLFLRANPDLMFSFLNAFLGTGDGDGLAVVGDAGHADLSCSYLLEVLQLLSELA